MKGRRREKRRERDLEERRRAPPRLLICSLETLYQSSSFFSPIKIEDDEFGRK